MNQIDNTVSMLTREYISFFYKLNIDTQRHHHHHRHYDETIIIQICMTCCSINITHK